MKKIFLSFILCTGAFLAIFSTALAQSDSLQLSLRKDWGYNSFGNEIQGTFSLTVKGPDNLTGVEFFMDDTSLGVVNQTPYSLQFLTDRYPLGDHTLKAVGTTGDGTKITSNTILTVFISASETGNKTLQIIAPILIVVFGAIILSALISMISWGKTKKQNPTVRGSYLMGGVICPRCAHPFGLSLLSINLLTGKLVRCPKCGKWSLLRSVSIDKLRAAEEAEMGTAEMSASTASVADKLKKELDDSRYQDL
jgi:hypothetical protein